MRALPHSSCSQGITLIETMVAVAILAILGSIGIPSFLDTMDRARLTGAADNLFTSIKAIQSEAIKTNQNATLTFTTGGAWSFTSNTTPVLTASSADYRGTSVAAGAELASAANTLTVEPKRNAITPRAAIGASPITLVTLQSERGHSISFRVAANSGVSTCTSTALRGYPPC